MGLDVTSKTVGKKRIDFSFLTNTTSDPASSSYRGDVDEIGTLVHTSTGLFTLTLKNKHRYCITAFASVAASSGDGVRCYINTGTGDGASSPQVFLIYLLADGNASTDDLADYASRRVSVALVMKNSSVGV